EMLKERGDWVPLGSADEQKPAGEGTVEAWARADDNPVGGWYGLKKGLRGRFANYVRRCSSGSAWQRSSTTRETTACAPPRRNPSGRVAAQRLAHAVHAATGELELAHVGVMHLESESPEAGVQIGSGRR
ncbi:MAG: hypothetical protein QOJ13_1247, partial [Gaiellales bacterium]|nr:hypothetical protein [Gaiellales bacterium]